MKKEIKHNCPTGFVWSPEKGMCINPELENIDGAEYPERRNKSSPNLTFPTRKKGGEIKKI